MSIINQALKKAQREQLWRMPQLFPGLRYHAPAVPTRRWSVILIALAIACGVGAGLRSWISMPVEPGTDAAIRPETSRPAMPTPRPMETAAIPAPERIVAPLHSSRDELAPAAETVAKLVTLSPGAVRTGQPVLEPTPLALPQRVAPPATVGTQPEPPDSRSAQTLYNQAMAAQDAGQVERAMLLLQQAISRDPTFTMAYNSLGNLYYQQQQYQQALTMYKRALAIDPQYVKARNNLGSTYLRLAMDEQAREELHKALAADDAYGLAYYNLACVYARAGDSAAAAKHLQRAIALEPQARLWAQTDDDFTRVRTTAVLRQLLEP
jgi:Flp pilus assembly protein TadD